MAKTKSLKTETRKIRPATSPEAEENVLISLAVDLVKERLINGTASSQETTHFLKLGSQKARLENEKLKHENELLQAKTEAIQSQKRSEELFDKAINAMKRYSGFGDEEENYEEFDDSDY